MIESKKKWLIERPDEQLVNVLVEELSIPTVHAKILVSRGITDPEEAKSFLHMDESSIRDPYLLYDMEKAVTLIQQAIANNKKIAIYGDYDADGVTSIAVLKTALERLNADVFFVIPDRFEHGYGPNKDLFQDIYEKGASLIITVDNGVTGVDEIAFAKTLGMTVIITDHHEVGEQWPEADAVIHPRHPKGEYGFGELAGVGVAFKLASALLGETPFDLLELVAIGTVADLVPLRDENRYFVKEGIKRMRTSKRPAIQALARVAGTEQSVLTEESIGFMIGPRINAAGRLGDASPAVGLLTTEDGAIALTLAQELDNLNKERQALVSKMAEEAEQIILEMYGEDIPLVFVIAKEGWNSGVVGIVASRITEKYYRPTIMLSIDAKTGTAKGSARSIEGFNMYEELAKNAELLPRFGGHPMAAGMSLDATNIQSLRDQLNLQAEKTLTDEQLLPTLSIDIPLSIEEIDVEVLESLELLRPFGMDFAKPVYLLEDVSANSVRKIGAAKNHLKLELTKETSVIDSIGFGLGSIADDITPGVKLSVTGDLQVNEWNGNKKPQLLIEDVRSKEWQLFDLRGVREPSRWLHMIPEKQTAFVVFQEETIAHFRTLLNNRPIYHYGKDEITDADHLVLLDIPNDSSLLEQVVAVLNPDRIYAHFHVLESMYFDAIPSREQFGWYYSFLKKQNGFHLRNDSEKLTNHKKWKKDSVYFMTKVFSELGFVKIENGFASVVQNVVKRELNDAPSYKERERQMKLEERLLYAPYMELKRWFDTLRNEAIDEGEQA